MAMKILKIDIETAPHLAHVWSFWKQNIAANQVIETGYVLCFAAQWHGQKKMEFYSQHKDGEEAMIIEAWRLLDEADAVIHYNGRRFDIPHLNKEFLKYGLKPPSPFHQIDLLETVKKQFKLPRNRLDDVLKFLGMDQKVSHAGHQLWVDCMAGIPKAWKKMREYNEQDVRVLGDLYETLKPWIKNHPNHALYMDTDRPVCSHCGSNHVVKCGVEHTKVMSYQRYRCSDCGTPLRGRTTILDRDKKGHVLTRSGL